MKRQDWNPLQNAWFHTIVSTVPQQKSLYKLITLTPCAGDISQIRKTLQLNAIPLEIFPNASDKVACVDRWVKSRKRQGMTPWLYFVHFVCFAPARIWAHFQYHPEAYSNLLRNTFPTRPKRVDEKLLILEWWNAWMDKVLLEVDALFGTETEQELFEQWMELQTSSTPNASKLVQKLGWNFCKWVVWPWLQSTWFKLCLEHDPPAGDCKEWEQTMWSKYMDLEIIQLWQEVEQRWMHAARCHKRYDLCVLFQQLPTLVMGTIAKFWKQSMLPYKLIANPTTQHTFPLAQEAFKQFAKNNTTPAFPYWYLLTWCFSLTSPTGMSSMLARFLQHAEAVDQVLSVVLSPAWRQQLCLPCLKHVEVKHQDENKHGNENETKTQHKQEQEQEQEQEHEHEQEHWQEEIPSCPRLSTSCSFLSHDEHVDEIPWLEEVDDEVIDVPSDSQIYYMDGIPCIEKNGTWFRLL